MVVSSFYKRFCRTTLIIMSFLLIILTASIIVNYAQSTGACTFPRLASDPRYRYPPNTIVYFELRNINEPERSQVLEAIRQWNVANQNNGSGVRFEPGSENSSYGLRIQFGPVCSLVDPNNPQSPCDPTAGQTNVTRVDSNDFVAGATITINPNYTTQSERRIYDPQLPGGSHPLIL